ncbi:MAG: Vacuolar protein sorting-associated protein 29 [Phylliscum demangeonii]|nr:MAG: Vacuolar protein sorting-associated protein 29 [Phylliscum demangeonii]
MASRLVLVLGDLFIPDRAPDIPAKFRKLLTPGKIGQVLCLGNLTDKDTYDFLRNLAPDLQIVKGDFDVEPYATTTTTTTTTAAHALSSSASTGAATGAASLPLAKIVSHGRLRIGFTHGHSVIPRGDADSLLIAARQMDVDVLLWGGSHRFEAYELEGKFFVNPGSATGAMSTAWPMATMTAAENGAHATVPSFCLMDVQGDVLVLYVYQLRTDAQGVENVNVEKVSFKKNDGSVAAATAAATASA